MGTLRIAFLSALVLELVATLSVALIAVGVGIRLVHGDLTLVIALVVLILAPECYLPLRAAGAAHHASEDGLEAVGRVAEVVGTRTQVAAAASGGSVHVDNLRRPARGRVRSGRHQLRRAAGGDLSDLKARAVPVSRHDRPLWVAWAVVGPITVDEHIQAIVDLATVVHACRRSPCSPARPRSPNWSSPFPVAERHRQVAHEVVARCICSIADRRPLDGRTATRRSRARPAEGSARRAVLLLDEPTAHLDPVTSRKVDKAIKSAARRRRSFSPRTARRRRAEDETFARVVTDETQPERPKRLPIPWKGAGLGILAACARDRADRDGGLPDRPRLPRCRRS